MTYIPRSISGIAGVLIPVAGGSINIQTRRDLLPTYVDDGLVGVSKDSSVVRYYSFQNAYCVASKKVSLDGYVDCSGQAIQGLPEQVGVLKVVSPMKINN